jgi:hypothetical protein
VLSLIDHPVTLFFVLFAALLAMVHLGHQLALFRSTDASEERHAQIVATRDATSLLLSLLMGFTLAMALPNYDLRKRLIIDEANAIGTTALRAQMLPEPARSKVLGLLREYVEARIAFAKAGRNERDFQVSQAHTKQLQNEMWQQSVAIAQDKATPITAIFIQTLNDSIDLSEKRLAALETRIPLAIWLMLVFMSVLACLLTGYSMRQRFVLVMLISPLMIAVVLALIADLDSPRTGLIRVGQQSLERLQTDVQAAPGNP